MAKAQVGWWGQCQGPGHGERFALLYPRELAEVFRIFLLVEALELCGHFINPCKHWAFFFVATQGHQRNSSSGAKTAGTFDGFGAQKVPWGSFPAKHGWFWRHFGSDLYLPRCYNCQGALVKGERLWPGNGSLWDRSQLSLRSSKHIKGKMLRAQGWLLEKSTSIIESWSQPSRVARPPRVATMHHRCGCRRVFWWGWKTVFVYQKRKSKGVLVFESLKRG